VSRLWTKSATAANHRTAIEKGTEQGIGFASSGFLFLFLCLSRFPSSLGGQVRGFKKRSFLL
jgi:hypothetical protein